MSARIILEVVSGPIQGRSFEFDRHDTFLFGRHKSCHARIAEDEQVSRHHFLLEANPPDARIRDLGSRNGTYVNGVKHGGRASPQKQVDGSAGDCEVDLNDGDLITVGRTTIRVKIARPPTPAAQANEQPASTVDLHGLFQQAAREARDASAPKIAGYEIGELLGKGGMGVVYKGTRKSDGRPVAVKLMLPKVAVDEHARRLFLREIDIARRLSHPNIVTLLESGAAGGAFYFVMDYCSGGSLHALAKRQGGKLPLKTAGPLMLDCLEGLDYAHRSGFVHRDLKPPNILLDQVGGRLAARISDFGLAKGFETAGLSGMTAMGHFGGTYLFMPPEQITDFKFCRPVSDLWSIAATFYHVLTGHYAFDFSSTRDPLAVILGEPPVPIGRRDGAIDPAVARVIDRALAREVEKRFQTGAEFDAALRLAIGER